MNDFYGEARSKKRNFFVKIFRRVPKNAFLACFLKSLPEAHKIFHKIGSLYYFGRARKIKLIDLNKRSTQVSNFFETPPPIFSRTVETAEISRKTAETFQNFLRGFSARHC